MSKHNKQSENEKSKAPASLIQLQKKFFAQLAIGNSRPDGDNESGRNTKSENFDIYFEGYRSRLQSAIEEDFPVSSVLIAEQFLGVFEKFASAMPSPTYTLNELGKYWLEYLNKKLIHEAKNQICELANLEWHLVRAHYRSDHSDEDDHIVMLDEEEGKCVIVPASTFLLPFEYDVTTGYRDEELPNKKPSWVVVWNSGATSKFLSITGQQAEVFETLEMHEEMDHVIDDLLSLGLKEQQLAKQVQEFFEIGTREGFLVFQG